MSFPISGPSADGTYHNGVMLVFFHEVTPSLKGTFALTVTVT